MFPVRFSLNQWNILDRDCNMQSYHKERFSDSIRPHTVIQDYGSTLVASMPVDVVAPETQKLAEVKF